MKTINSKKRNRNRLFLLSAFIMCLIFTCIKSEAMENTDSESVIMNSETDNIDEKQTAMELIRLQEYIFYDNCSNIVYYCKQGVYPYYSDNGNLCRYNKNTKTISDIETNEIVFEFTESMPVIDDTSFIILCITIVCTIIIFFILFVIYLWIIIK